VGTNVLVQVVPGGLRAVNGVESDKLDTLRGKEVMAELSQPRNILFHRKYFALLGVAQDMVDDDLTAKQFRALCTVGAGHCDFVQGDDGLIAIPKSISFAAMDDTEFERLYQDTLTYICKKWVLDADQINRIVDFM